MNDNTKKRKRGDRWDGRWVKEITGLQAMMFHIMPKRVDSEVYLNNSIDVTNLLKYLEKKNAEHPEYKTTVFHCVVMAIAKMIYERPYMNRFIAGYRMYERYDISLSFVAKRRFLDHSEESLMIIKAKEEDTLDSISSHIAGDVKEMRKSETANGGIDSTFDILAKIPRPIIIPVMAIVRNFGFWGKTIKSVSEGDTNYSTVLISNLGSIKCPAVYHHLTNYGTNGFVLTIGMIHKEEVLQEDGTKQIRDVMDFGATLDERIADGFYFARSFKLVQYIFAHPELLDCTLATPSGFTYE